MSIDTSLVAPLILVSGSNLYNVTVIVPDDPTAGITTDPHVVVAPSVV